MNPLLPPGTPAPLMEPDPRELGGFPHDAPIGVPNPGFPSVREHIIGETPGGFPVEVARHHAGLRLGELVTNAADLARIVEQACEGPRPDLGVSGRRPVGALPGKDGVWTIFFADEPDEGPAVIPAEPDDKNEDLSWASEVSGPTGKTKLVEIDNYLLPANPKMSPGYKPHSSGSRHPAPNVRVGKYVARFPGRHVTGGFFPPCPLQGMEKVDPEECQECDNDTCPWHEEFTDQVEERLGGSEDDEDE